MQRNRPVGYPPAMQIYGLGYPPAMQMLCLATPLQCTCSVSATRLQCKRTVSATCLQCNCYVSATRLQRKCTVGHMSEMQYPCLFYPLGSNCPVIITHLQCNRPHGHFSSSSCLVFALRLPCNYTLLGDPPAMLPLCLGEPPVKITSLSRLPACNTLRPHWGWISGPGHLLQSGGIHPFGQRGGPDRQAFC
jgi:hypothetical protein